MAARSLATLALLLLLALVPVYASVFDQAFYLQLFARIMILAIAAISLDLIMGYGGMVSFGHACYLGLGAYSVGILAHHGITDGFVQWGVALGLSALVALLIGAVSIRTSGVYFIMITLAFAQMLYFLGVSLKAYGGDDGLTINQRSDFGRLLDLSNTTVFYYVVLAVLAGALFLCHRFVNARFGMVLRGTRSNERRMRAVGFSTFRYRLVAFVIAGTLCGLAGALLANLTQYASPAYMSWPRSGELIIMVVLGGMGSLSGALFGAVAFLLLEEWLAEMTTHWMAILGPILVCLVLFARRGIFGLLPEGKRPQ